jgi:hypothetical protein
MYISRYVSKASFAAISSLRSFGAGVVPSSSGGSYSLDHGDLTNVSAKLCNLCEESNGWSAYMVGDLIGNVLYSQHGSTAGGALVEKHMHSPIAIAVSIVIACEIVPSGGAICHDFERLVDTT